jgi:Rrf2 family protein
MISQTAEYALRAAAFLGVGERIPRKAMEISRSTQIPSSYLHKVLNAMARAHLVHSRRGPRGGFVLARPPESISALDVVTAVDRWPRIEECPLRHPDQTDCFCPLHQCLEKIQALLEEGLRRFTLRDLVERAPFAQANTPGVCPHSPDRFSSKKEKP